MEIVSGDADGRLLERDRDRQVSARSALMTEPMQKHVLAAMSCLALSRLVPASSAADVDDGGCASPATS